MKMSIYYPYYDENATISSTTWVSVVGIKNNNTSAGGPSCAMSSITASKLSPNASFTTV